MHVDKNSNKTTLSLPQNGNIQEMTSGCNTAIVSYGLDENMKPCKMVILFNNQDLNAETVQSGANSIMLRNGNISIAKNFMYIFRNGMFKRACGEFFAILYKNIFGYIPNGNIHDCRSQYNNYWKGGNYGNV